MAPPRPETNRSPFICIGKEAHHSPSEARKVVRNRKRFGKSVEFYRCPHCHLWHTGRAGKPKGFKSKFKNRRWGDEADGEA